jgi:hypothetical protein
MPATPRPKGKPNEIALNLLGDPLNKKIKKTKKEKKLNKKLTFEENSRGK